MAIIVRLKNALEFARFQDPAIREAVVDAINELALDLDELEFEEATNTRAAFGRLDAAISDFENRETTITVVDTNEPTEIDAPVDVIITESETEVDPIVPIIPADDDIDL